MIVEGADALRPPEAGFSEDLVRAWFILTGEPVVSHLLVAPKGAARAEIEPAIALLEQARQVGHERRRELRGSVTERAGLDRDRVQPSPCRPALLARRAGPAGAPDAAPAGQQGIGLPLRLGGCVPGPGDGRRLVIGARPPVRV